MIASLDESTFLTLVSITRADDPRMDEAIFRVAGPNLTADSVIDAYLIDNLFGELRALLAGEVAFATFGLGELTFRRGEGSQIRVELGGGPYIGGAERTWFVAFTATDRQVSAFHEALEAAWRETAV